MCSARGIYDKVERQVRKRREFNRDRWHVRTVARYEWLEMNGGRRDCQGQVRVGDVGKQAANHQRGD